MMHRLRVDLKGPLVEIVASVAYARRASDAPFLLPCRAPSPSHRERSRSKPTPSAATKRLTEGVKDKPHFRNQRKKDTFWCPSFWVQGWDLNLMTSGL